MAKMKKKIPIAVKIVIVIVWVVLFGLLLRRDYFLESVDLRELQALEQAEAEEYQSVYFKNNKVGYVHNSYKKRETSGWLLEQQASLAINVAGSNQKIDLKLYANLSPENLLEDFDFTFFSPFYQMTAKGKVNGNKVNYTLTTNSNTIVDSFTFSSPPLLATSRRGYLLTQGIEEGEKRKIPWFDPFSLTGKESVMEYKGQESIRIGGRVEKLHKFTESFSGARINSWLNDSGTIVKEESPAGFVFLKEPKFKALAMDDSSQDILAAVAVTLQSPMPESFSTLNVMRYKLAFPKDVNLDIEGDRQTFEQGIVTLEKEKIPDFIPDQYSSCADLGNSMNPSPYVQSDNEKIISIANKLVKDEKNQVDRIRNISKWVYQELEKRPVIGLPDALTTLQSKQGDCNEHAALFAAISRAANIPTRIVAGVTYHKKAFYYHAWNEVCLGSKWISVDTTLNQIPADLSHIRLIKGEMEEQVRIGGLLGMFTIQPLDSEQH